MKRYKIINPDPKLQRNLMAFGFECGKGWYPLIRELLDKLQDIADENDYDFEVTQVKEKYGLLRVYMSWGTEEVFDLIDEYEKKSGTICEVCGEPGELKENKGWYSTSCDKHK